MRSRPTQAEKRAKDKGEGEKNETKGWMDRPEKSTYTSVYTYIFFHHHL